MIVHTTWSPRCAFCSAWIWTERTRWRDRHTRLIARVLKRSQFTCSILQTHILLYALLNALGSMRPILICLTMCACSTSRKPCWVRSDRAHTSRMVTGRRLRNTYIDVLEPSRRWRIYLLLITTAKHCAHVEWLSRL